MRTGVIQTVDVSIGDEHLGTWTFPGAADFHFMRYDNGVWTHKRGGSPIETLPEGLTPDNDSAWGSPYISSTIYFLIKDDWE